MDSVAMAQAGHKVRRQAQQERFNRRIRRARLRVNKRGSKTVRTSLTRRS